LLGNFRFEDTVCRYGGEEFVVIMRHPDGDFAKDRCEKFRKLIAQNRYQVSDSKKIKLTISAGVMTIRPSKKKVSLESLVKKADELLYKAKKSGRNKVIAES
jgi:two-component system cell cycle response regulator